MRWLSQSLSVVRVIIHLWLCGGELATFCHAWKFGREGGMTFWDGGGGCDVISGEERSEMSRETTRYIPLDAAVGVTDMLG